MDKRSSGDLVLQDERGNIVGVETIGIGEIIRLINKYISEDELKNTFCLQFVDS